MAEGRASDGEAYVQHIHDAIRSRRPITRIDAWADARMDLYFHQHNLPRHPLAEQGYLTMGDWHSIHPATREEAELSLFNGGKYECGLHLASGSADFQI